MNKKNDKQTKNNQPQLFPRTESRLMERSPSLQKIQQIRKEEQQTSNAFRIQNFVKCGNFDLTLLKSRISELRSNKPPGKSAENVTSTKVNPYKLTMKSQVQTDLNFSHKKTKSNAVDYKNNDNCNIKCPNNIKINENYEIKTNNNDNDFDGNYDNTNQHKQNTNHNDNKNPNSNDNTNNNDNITTDKNTDNNPKINIKTNQNNNTNKNVHCQYQSKHNNNKDNNIESYVNYLNGINNSRNYDHLDKGNNIDNGNSGNQRDNIKSGNHTNNGNNGNIGNYINSGNYINNVNYINSGNERDNLNNGYNVNNIKTGKLPPRKPRNNISLLHGCETSKNRLRLNSQCSQNVHFVTNRSLELKVQNKITQIQSQRDICGVNGQGGIRRGFQKEGKRFQRNCQRGGKMEKQGNKKEKILSLKGQIQKKQPKQRQTVLTQKEQKQQLLTLFTRKQSHSQRNVRTDRQINSGSQIVFVGQNYQRESKVSEYKRQPKVYSVGKRRNLIPRTPNKLDESRTTRGEGLGFSRMKSFKKQIGKICIDSENTFLKLQRGICYLWELYEKLGNLVQILSDKREELLNKCEKKDNLILYNQIVDQIIIYRSMVCSPKFQFLTQVLQNCLEFHQSRTILTSRLLQTLSIFYTVLVIIEQNTDEENFYLNEQKNNQYNRNKNVEEKNQQLRWSHLVNFIGISGRNILFLIKLLVLTHHFQDEKNYISFGKQSKLQQRSKKFHYSKKTKQILSTISQFQRNSYLEQINNVKEIIMRIEHNNETIALVRGKLNKQLESQQQFIKHFQKFTKQSLMQRLQKQMQIIGNNEKQNLNCSESSHQNLNRNYSHQNNWNKNFSSHSKISKNNPKNQQSKNKMYESKPLFEYCFFVFEYLSYTIHQNWFLVEMMKDISVAPAPYLCLEKQYTVFMDPIKICLKQTPSKIYLRPFSDKLIEFLSEKFNLVFWTDETPATSDHLFNIIENKEYRQKLLNCQNLSEYQQNKSQFHRDSSMSSKNGSKKHKRTGSVFVKSDIRRLYRHHCLKCQNIQKQQSQRYPQCPWNWIKDISRVGCGKQKYFIIDTSCENYPLINKDKIILVHNKSRSKDNKLMVLVQKLKFAFENCGNASLHQPFDFDFALKSVRGSIIEIKKEQTSQKNQKTFAKDDLRFESNNKSHQNIQII